MVVLLITLSNDEPGENFQEVHFADAHDTVIPDFEPSLAWGKNPATLVPNGGYLAFRYYSGADKGCIPVWPSRKELASKTLIGAPDDFEQFADVVTRSLF